MLTFFVDNKSVNFPDDRRGRTKDMLHKVFMSTWDWKDDVGPVLSDIDGDAAAHAMTTAPIVRRGGCWSC
jgi:hypothetical protein